MKLLEHKNENHQEYFKMELEPEELEGMLDDAYQYLVNEINIDGFRKGKAPRDVLERHVGKEALFDHAMKEYLPRMIDEMMVENKIRAYMPPSVKITSRDPVIFETTVSLPPDVTLGDYNSIKMKPNPVDITGNEVEEILKHAQHQEASLVATGAPAEMEDVLLMDIESNIDGEPYIVAKRDLFQLKPGLRFPAPGFVEELIGIKSGDEKEFSLKLPDTFPDKANAGKDVFFCIKIIEVQREVLPELNDDFAHKLDPDCGGITVVRQNVYDNLKLRAEENENKAFEERVIDALVEKSQIAFPPIMVENEIERMVREYMDRLRDSAQSEEVFNEIQKQVSEEKLRETYRPQAEARVKRNLVVSKVVEIEKLEVAETDIDMQIAAITAEPENQPRKSQEQIAYLSDPENRDTLRWWMIANKAKQLLVDKAKAD